MHRVLRVVEDDAVRTTFNEVEHMTLANVVEVAVLVGIVIVAVRFFMKRA